MVIVDTTVWIDFFRAKEPIIHQVQELIHQKNVIGTQCVFAELLQGAKNKRERDMILEYWQHLVKYDETDIMLVAGQYAGEHKLMTKGVGLLDAVIVCMSLRSKSKIWTLDKKLKSVLPVDLIYVV